MKVMKTFRQPCFEPGTVLMGGLECGLLGCDFQVYFHYVCGVTVFIVCRWCVLIGWNLLRRELLPLNSEAPHTRAVLPSVLTAQAKLCQVCTVWYCERFYRTRAVKTVGDRSVQFVI